MPLGSQGSQGSRGSQGSPANLVLVAGAIVLAAAALRAQDPPRFSASVEVLSVDVTVLDSSGRPLTDLQADDFTVRVNGLPRGVVTAEWVPLAAPAAPPPPPPPAGYSSNEGATTGRLILLVIDQPNIRFGGMARIQRALESFVDGLQPTDRIAAVGLGYGSASTPFTGDRERVKTALSRMPGMAELPDSWLHNITLSEAMDIYQTNVLTLDSVLRRECGGLGAADFGACRLSVESTASSMAGQVIAAGRDTYYGLRSLLEGLGAIDAPKTLVLVSEGFVFDENLAALSDLGTLAAASRTAIYALKLDDQTADVVVRDLSMTPFADRRVRAIGLEVLTSAARGTLLYAIGNTTSALARLESELGGYYLLGLESDPADTDVQTFRMDVRVARRGATVRTRREVRGGRARPAGDPLGEAVTALNSPLMLSALPLRIAAFSLPDPDPSNVQLLLHAAIGSGYTSPGAMALAYTITDPSGRIVETQAAIGRLSPVMSAVPSPLQFRGSASLPPGEYLVRFAVADGERVGTVEHPVEARLAPAGGVRVSELVVGGPVQAREPLQPSVGHTVNFGLLHGYLEAVGSGSGRLRVRYEVASTADGEALLSAEVEPVRAGERAIFAHMMPVRRLPDGEYVLRATVLDDSTPISTLSRAFEVAPPPVLMAPAEGGGGSLAAAPAEVFLPVDDTQLNRPFDPREAARREVVRTFRERMPDQAVDAFDRGVAQLSDGDYPRAETSFKSAIQIDADSTAPIAYLAATFAAAGQDLQAAGAWQTALIDGDDLPQIYVWLADALIRARDMVQARSILEEALAKWPADERFARPLALVYATFGLGREAVRMIERHLEAEPDDAEALALAVEWIYHLHIAGASAQTRVDDARHARQYADAYVRTNGPQAALVKEWVGAIEDGR